MVAIGREMPSVPVTGSVAESPSTTAHRVARMMQIKRRFKEPKLVGYAIEEYISSGTFGRTYRARRIKDNKIVAIKVIKPASSFADVVDETCNVAQAQGPNVIQMITTATVQEPCSHALIFEHVEFIPFNTFCSNARPKDKVCYLQNLFLGIETIHRAGIVHRDIKPSNILHDRNLKTFRIIDFGLSHERQGKSSTSHHAGTHGFRAPELLLKSISRVTGAADVWAAGMTIASLLTNTVPFIARSENELEVIAQLVGSEAIQNIALANDQCVSLPSVTKPRLRNFFVAVASQWLAQGEPFNFVYSLLCGCLQPDHTQRKTSIELVDTLKQHFNGSN